MQPPDHVAAPDALADADRALIVRRSIEADRARYETETKFCPACGSGMLGGVMGDLSVVGCADCGHVTAKYLMAA